MVQISESSLISALVAFGAGPAGAAFGWVGKSLRPYSRPQAGITSSYSSSESESSSDGAAAAESPHSSEKSSAPGEGGTIRSSCECSSSPKRLPQSIKFRHLLLCCTNFMIGDHKPTTLFLISIPLSELLGAKKEKISGTHMLQDVMCWDYRPHSFTSRSFLLSQNGKLYVMSQMSHAHDEYDGDWDWKAVPNFLCMSEYDIDSRDDSVVINKINSHFVLPLKFRQLHPIIVEIDGVIYILSRDNAEHHRQTEHIENFKSYDTKTHEWQVLPCPPKYVWCPSQFIVVGSKLCVSTGRYSSAFDTHTKEWRSCCLFEDFIMQDKDNGFSQFFGQVRISVQQLDWMDPNKSKLLGLPFPFKIQGLVVYEKFLICSLAVKYPGLLAFRLEDGKVSTERPQDLLFRWEKVLRVHNTYGWLVDLGDGFICLTLEDSENSGKKKFFTFRVLLAEDGQSLIYDETNESLVYMEDDRTWENIGHVFAC